MPGKRMPISFIPPGHPLVEAVKTRAGARSALSSTDVIGPENLALPIVDITMPGTDDLPPLPSGTSKSATIKQLETVIQARIQEIVQKQLNNFPELASLGFGDLQDRPDGKGLNVEFQDSEALKKFRAAVVAEIESIKVTVEGKTMSVACSPRSDNTAQLATWGSRPSLFGRDSHDAKVTEMRKVSADVHKNARANEDPIIIPLPDNKGDASANADLTDLIQKYLTILTAGSDFQILRDPRNGQYSLMQGVNSVGLITFQVSDNPRQMQMHFDTDAEGVDFAAIRQTIIDKLPSSDTVVPLPTKGMVIEDVLSRTKDPVPDSASDDAKYKEIYEARLAEHTANAQAKYLEDCKVAYKEQLLAAVNKSPPGDFSIDSDKIMLKGVEVGSIAFSRDYDGSFQFKVTPNEGNAITAHFLSTNASTFTGEKFIPPDIRQYDFVAPKEPITFAADKPASLAMAGIIRAYKRKAPEDGQLSLVDEDGSRVLYDGTTRVGEVEFTTAAEGTGVKIYIKCDPEHDGVRDKLQDSIGNNPNLQIETMRQELPEVDIPTAPTPASLSGADASNAEYAGKYSTAVSAHKQACDTKLQEFKDGLLDSYTDKLLEHINASSSKTRPTDTYEISNGMLKLNGRDIGEVSISIDGNTPTLSITCLQPERKDCATFKAIANNFKYDTPSIDFPEFKAPSAPTAGVSVDVTNPSPVSSTAIAVDVGEGKPKSPIDAHMGGDGQDDLALGTGGKALTFAKERAIRLAQKDDTKKIMGFSSSPGSLSQEAWQKMSAAFMNHMQNMKDKEAQYAAKGATPSYIKAYQEEGKNFYQNMTIEKVDDNNFRIKGTDVESGDMPYQIDFRYDPASKSFSATMSGAMTDKQLLTSVEAFRQSALNSQSNGVRITSCTASMETLKRTIGMLNAQGLSPKLSTLIEHDVRQHLRRQMVAEGKHPSAEDVNRELQSFMAYKFEGIDPEKIQPPPPPKTKPNATAPASTASAKSTAAPSTARPVNSTAAPSTSKPNPSSATSSATRSRLR